MVVRGSYFFVACGLLVVVCCSLRVACCSLFVVRRLLDCCLLCVVVRCWFNAFCMLFVDC